MQTTPQNIVEDLDNNLKINAEVSLLSNNFSVFSAVNKKMEINDFSFISGKKIDNKNQIKNKKSREARMVTRFLGFLLVGVM